MLGLRRDHGPPITHMFPPKAKKIYQHVSLARLREILTQFDHLMTPMARAGLRGHR